MKLLSLLLLAVVAGCAPPEHAFFLSVSDDLGGAPHAAAQAIVGSGDRAYAVRVNGHEIVGENPGSCSECPGPVAIEHAADGHYRWELEYPGGMVIHEQLVSTDPMTLPSATTARVGDQLDYSWPAWTVPGHNPEVRGMSVPDAHFACMSATTVLSGARRATATVIAQSGCSSTEPNYDLHGDVVVFFSVDFADSPSSGFRRTAGKPMRFTQ